MREQLLVFCFLVWSTCNGQGQAVKQFFLLLQCETRYDKSNCHETARQEFQTMDDTSVAHKHLKTARDSFDRDYDEKISALSQMESRLPERLRKSNRKKYSMNND